MKSFYEATVIDVAVLYENYTTLAFVFGDTTGHAKVSRAHCRSRLGLPVLASYKVPNVTHNDAEDINVKHSNFKILLSSKTKTSQLFCIPLWLFTIQ